jgi:dTDP-4-dehydrorhamnose reductase
LYGDVESLDESAVTAVVNDVRSGKPKKVDHWARRYPTLVDDLALVIRDMAERKLNGVYHWCGQECFTKYEMAREMGDLLGASIAHLTPDENPSGGTPRPRDCKLDTSALTSLGICHHTPFRSALKRILL